MILCLCFQIGEEECGPELVEQTAAEPYFVDFLRDAPEATGIYDSPPLPFTCKSVRQNT